MFLGRGGTHVDPNALRRRFHDALAGPAYRECDCMIFATRSARSWSAASTLGPCSTGWVTGSIEVTEMYMAFRDRAEDAAKVSDAFRVA